MSCNEDTLAPKKQLVYSAVLDTCFINKITALPSMTVHYCCGLETEREM